MRTDIEAISRRRHICLIVLRSVAVVLMLAGMLAVGWSLQVRMGRYSGFEFLVVPLLSLLAAFWVPAMVLAAASRPLARWLVPVPSPLSECPQCGYSLKNLNAPICPECGLTLRTLEQPDRPSQK